MPDVDIPEGLRAKPRPPVDFAATDWVGVTSSNVGAVRFVPGNDYPLEVRFKAKGRSAGSTYAYKAPRDVYEGMLGAASKGKYRHEVLSAYLYRKLA